MSKNTKLPGPGGVLKIVTIQYLIDKWYKISDLVTTFGKKISPFHVSFTEMLQRYISEVVSFGVHSPALFMCEYESAVRFSIFLHILPSEAGELHQPVVPLSGSQPETAHPFPFNLPLAAFRSPGIHSGTPAPFSFSSLFPFFSHPRFNLPPKCQKCSVRRTRYVPYESVFLLLSN